jgi:hypothetical protein
MVMMMIGMGDGEVYDEYDEYLDHHFVYCDPIRK